MHPHHPQSRHILRALLLLSAVFAMIVPGTVQAQDARTPVQVLDHEGQLSTLQGGTVQWSPDSTRLLTATTEFNCGEACAYALYLWDMVNGGDPVILPLDGPVDFMAWNADGTYFLSHTNHPDVATADAVYVWPADGGDPLRLHHEARIQGARWSLDGRHVLTWDWDAALLIWPVMESGNPVEVRPPRQGDDDWRLPVLQAEWSADGQYAFGYVFGDDYIGETVYVYAADGSGLVTILEHDAAINGMIPATYYGNALLTWSGDGTARLWTVDGSADPVIFEHESQVYHAAWNGSVNRIITVTETGVLWTWTWDNTGITSRTLLNHPDQAYGVVANPVYENAFATWVGSGTPDSRYEVRVWGMTRLHYEEPIVLHHPAEVAFALWSPASNALLTYAYDNVVRVFYRLTEERVDYIALPHKTPLDGAAWSPDGSQVATWSGSQVFIWSPFEE